MKVIAVNEQVAMVRQILNHLGLPAGAPSLRAPPVQPDGVVIDRPRAWSYEPFADNLPGADPLIA